MSITKEKCYKKGLLWGTTILDVSNDINSLDDSLNWLNIMNTLASDTDQSRKKDDRGMRFLRGEVGKEKLKLKDFETFPELISLVAKLNKIKKGSEKAWFGRTKQVGFQKTLDRVKQCVDKEILNLINNNEKIKGFGKCWSDFYTSFSKELTNLFKKEKNTIVDEDKWLLYALCPKLNTALSSYIKTSKRELDVENYEKASTWINGDFKKNFSEIISNILLDFLPTLVPKTRLQLPNLDFQKGEINDKIKEFNRFMRCIRDAHDDINKHKDIWDSKNVSLVCKLKEWSKKFGLEKDMPTLNLKNSKSYVLTDLWRLLAFVRGIFVLLRNYDDLVANSFDGLARFFDDECSTVIVYICTSSIIPTNLHEKVAHLFNNIKKQLDDYSSKYYRSGSEPDGLERDIDKFKQYLQCKLNNLNSKLRFIRFEKEEYKGVIFPFLDKINCYFDHAPLLTKLEILDYTYNM